MGAPGSERAIVSITRWARRDEWRPRFDAVIEAHFAPVLGALDLPADELPEVLGEAFAPLFGCVLDDFVTCDFGPGQPSIVADYLKRRGFKERAPVKSYLRALEASVMSVYEVVATAPGEHVLLRDLVRGGEPLPVEARGASQSLAPGDHLAARVLGVNGRTYLAAGVLDLPPARAGELAQNLRRLARWFREQLARSARKGVTLADLEAAAPLDDLLLSKLAPLFTCVWLQTALGDVLGIRLEGDGIGSLLADMLAELPDSEAEAALAEARPELAGRSPRQAARSRAGRRQVAQWLKYQEAVERDGADARQGQPPPDLGWMWQALGIEHLR